MNRIDVWLSRRNVRVFGDNPASVAVDTWGLIQQRPSSIALTRKIVGRLDVMTLAPQTVRLEVVQSIRSATEHINSQMDISDQYVVVIGLANHPTLPNLDILRLDTFFYNSRMFEVIEVIDTIPGRRLASAGLTP